jgi:DNA-binding CsgD family transcriptional regulator
MRALALFFAGDETGGITSCDQLICLANARNNLSWDREARGIKAVNLSLTRLAASDVVDEMRTLLDDPAIGSYWYSIVTLLAIAEGDLGNFPRADELLARAIPTARASRSENLGALHWAHSEVAWSAGRIDECAEVAHTVTQSASPINFGTPAAAVLIRWTMWERGEDCSTAPGPLVVYPVQRGLVDEARGVELLGTPGHERAAAAAFLDAAALHDQYLRRNALRCRWAAGEALRRAGDLPEATALLGEVRNDCDRHGFLALARRVEASLRQLGQMAVAAVPTNGSTNGSARGVLTPREHEVLALVRQGRSTQEIAAHLQLRPSTVESHIRKAKRRLGASNRREAELLADARD